LFPPLRGKYISSRQDFYDKSCCPYGLDDVGFPEFPPGANGNPPDDEIRTTVDPVRALRETIAAIDMEL